MSTVPHDVLFEAACLRAGLEFGPPADASARIKTLQDRAMLAAAGLRGQSAPTADELAAFLDDVRAPGFFRFHPDGVEECAAFVAALASRIPYPDPGAHAREVLDEATASPLGAEEARGRLAVL